MSGRTGANKCWMSRARGGAAGGSELSVALSLSLVAQAQLALSLVEALVAQLSVALSLVAQLSVALSLVEPLVAQLSVALSLVAHWLGADTMVWTYAIAETAK